MTMGGKNILIELGMKKIISGYINNKKKVGIWLRNLAVGSIEMNL
jgi:hypothetical protein